MVEPFYADRWLTVFGGDCRDVLRELPAESVHCVITSPPYWGLRDYGTATWEGGDPGCGHYLPEPDRTHDLGRNRAASNGTFHGGPAGQKWRTYDRECGKCGARRIDSQLGLEQTPEEYVRAMVDVFREVRRVLRDDGTVWLNLGDSYSSSIKGDNRSDAQQRPRDAVGFHSGSGERWHTGTWKVETGLKPKDLVGIPWRVAFALQADGWYLRSDIIWSKPNPMPESVTDRPTKSHEYLFLLAKSARYYFDADAVREGLQTEPHAPGNTARDDWQAIGGASVSKGMSGHLAEPDRVWGNPAGRNIRSVWTIATAPYPGAHFATFPPKLVEPCVKAGCPSDGVVLDPFAGTGTVGMVAQSLSRRAVLIDLNPDYLRQCLERNRDMPLGLAVG